MGPTPHDWIEELLLQTYLFAGFPRALNGMREWRRLAPALSRGTVAPSDALTRERLRPLVMEILRDHLRELERRGVV